MSDPVVIVCVAALATCGLTILRLLASARSAAIRRTRLAEIEAERLRAEGQPRQAIPEVR